MLKEKCRSLCTSITISMWNAIVVKCVEDRSKFKSMRYKISARNESSIRCFIIILGLIRTEKLRFNPFNNSNN